MFIFVLNIILNYFGMYFWKRVFIEYGARYVNEFWRYSDNQGCTWNLLFWEMYGIAVIEKTDYKNINIIAVYLKIKAYVLSASPSIHLSPSLPQKNLNLFLCFMFTGKCFLHLIESKKSNSQPNLDFLKIYCLLILHSTYNSLNELTVLKYHWNLLMWS